MMDDQADRHEVSHVAKYPGLQEFVKASQGENSLVRNANLKESESGAIEMTYETSDGLSVSLQMSEPTPEESERLRSSGDYPGLVGEGDVFNYLKADSFKISGTAGEVDLVSDLGEGSLFMVPVDANTYKALPSFNQETPLIEILSGYLGNTFASSIDGSAGAMSMAPVLGQADLIVYEHEKSHYLRHVEDKTSGNTGYAQELELAETNGNLAEVIALEESIANTAGEINGKKLLDQINGENPHHQEVADMVMAVSRQAYAQRYGENDPGKIALFQQKKLRDSDATV